MPEVESSAIDRIDYAADRRLLFVTFTSGRRYVYFDVPAAVYFRFRNAESAGRYFNAQIRGKYDFRELRKA